jgi:A/G-specific adenine glycosylase
MTEAVDWSHFRRNLLRWYTRHHRAMPWRVEPGLLADPYSVLVSETMLQQTQVATVIDYYRRFLRAFPNVAALARADEQDVLRLWQGLGYYRRARFLHRAARAIMEHHGGEVPGTVEALSRLPGVGRYTAGAVASIAFGLAAPVVDGNVARVLSRVTGTRRAADDRRVRDALWDTMGRLVRVRGRYGPGDINQAVMELGATVCVPRGPACETCPVRTMCRGYAAGEPESHGSKSRRRAPIDVVHRVVAVRCGTTFLFERRGDEGLWAGMWQMPTVEGGRRTAQISRVKGADVGPLTKLGRFTHLTTHRRITFEVYSARPGEHRRAGGTWRPLNRLDDLPMSNAQKRVVAMVQAAAAD